MFAVRPSDSENEDGPLLISDALYDLPISEHFSRKVVRLITQSADRLGLSAPLSGGFALDSFANQNLVPQFFVAQGLKTSRIEHGLLDACFLVFNPDSPNQSQAMTILLSEGNSVQIFAPAVLLVQTSAGEREERELKAAQLVTALLLFLECPAHFLKPDLRDLFSSISKEKLGIYCLLAHREKNEEQLTKSLEPIDKIFSSSLLKKSSIVSFIEENNNYFSSEAIDLKNFFFRNFKVEFGEKDRVIERVEDVERNLDESHQVSSLKKESDKNIERIFYSGIKELKSMFSWHLIAMENEEEKRKRDIRLAAIMIVIFILVELLILRFADAIRNWM